MSNRILTTHTGSLPRPQPRHALLSAQEQGAAVDPAVFDARVQEAVCAIVSQQINAGLAIVNDGQMSRPSSLTYAKDRLSGLGGENRPPPFPGNTEFAVFPALYSGPLLRHAAHLAALRFPCCTGKVAKENGASSSW